MVHGNRAKTVGILNELLIGKEREMSELKMKTVAMPDNLPDMPIDPAWIQEGEPTARGAIVTQSADKRVSGGYWQCSEGRFEWTFGWDEFAHVFEGKVAIEEDGGDSYTLGPGDTVHFPAGLKTHWHVMEPVRKYFVIRTADPLEL